MHNRFGKDNLFILNENKWKRKYKQVKYVIVLYNGMTDRPNYQYIQKVFEIIP